MGSSESQRAEKWEEPAGSLLSPGAASMPQAGVSGLPSANHSSWQLWTRSIVSEAGQSPQWSLPGFPQLPEVCYNS